MQISMFGQLSGFGDGSPIDGTIAYLTELRDEGFRRVWMSQLPYEPDLLSVLAVALREVDTIEVASGVVPIQNQHPMQMAQRALTVSLASGGRFILGLGMTHAAVTEGMWGIPWDKPVRRLNEYLDGLLPLLAGEPANAVGETVTTRGALMIPGAPRPDVYIAALGPQLLRLAGRRTAGTCTWMTGPATLGGHVGPTLRQAAADTGRPEGAVRVVAACRSASPTMRTPHVGMPPSSFPCTERCPPTGRCWTARGTRGPRTPRSSGMSTRCRSVSTSSRPPASTSSSARRSTRPRRVVRGTRALLRSRDS